MNADNVKPYGKLVHEAAEAGGVDEFCDAIEQNGYIKGASDKQTELIPYLVAMGVTIVIEGAVIGYHSIKDKLEQRASKKANLEKEAQYARDSLNLILDNNIEEGGLDKEFEIIENYTDKQEDYS